MIWILLIIYIIFISVYFTIKLKFKNLNFMKMISKIRKEYKSIFYVSVATKIGVGCIIGTSIAIYTGGVGSIFWIWVFGIITTSLIYVESLLGNKYQKKLKDGYVGGPNFYIKYGLNNKFLSVLYLIILIITYSFFFLMIQTNTINLVIEENFNFNQIVVLIFTFIILLLISFSTPKEIIKYINKVVPFMCIFLLIISLFVIIKNYNLIFDIFSSIIRSAFDFRSVLGGLIPTILISIKRNIFQNELLIGTTSIASAIKKGNTHSIAATSVIANLFITFVVCTLIAFLIIIFKLNNEVQTINYINLISQVFSYHFESLGSIILTILLGLFAFTTIISGFYFGLTNLMYLTKNKTIILFFRINVLIFTLSGAILKANFVWYLVDSMMLILIIINIICITKLRSKINYDR